MIPIVFEATVQEDGRRLQFFGSIVRAPVYGSREVQPEPLDFEIRSCMVQPKGRPCYKVTREASLGSLVEDYYDQILLQADEAYGKWLTDQMEA